MAGMYHLIAISQLTPHIAISLSSDGNQPTYTSQVTHMNESRDTYQ